MAKNSQKQNGNIEIYGVVSGSFNRFFPQIQEAVSALSELGITILSPAISKPVSNINGFVMLEKDEGSPADIEKNHLDAIAKSDFLYIVNPEGYIGRSVALEIGFAMSKGVPIYSSEVPKDNVFKSFLLADISFNSLKGRIKQIKDERSKNKLKTQPTLAELQEYVADIIKIRGFAEETLVEVALLLVEEVGELARAIRCKTGLKISLERSRNVKSLDSELADCLLYLIDLANLAGIDLEKALRDKEALNAKREWV